MCKAYLIDPKERSITIVESNGLQDIYKHLECTMIEVATYIQDTTGENVIYVDEEGLLKPMDFFFIVRGAHQPFAGRGLLVGCEEEGDVDPTVSLDFVKQMISFTDIYTLKAGLEKMKHGVLQ
jgi:hypothetical protein